MGLRLTSPVGVERASGQGDLGVKEREELKHRPPDRTPEHCAEEQNAGKYQQLCKRYMSGFDLV